MDVDLEELDWDDGSDEEPNGSSLAVAKLKCEVSALKEQLDASEKQGSVQKQEIAALFEQRERSEQALKLANASAEKERQKLQEERDSLKKQVEDLEHALADNKRIATHQETVLQQVLEHRSNELSQSKRQCHELRMQLQLRTEESEKLLSKYNAHRALIEALDKQLVSTHSSLHDVQNRVTKTTAQLTEYEGRSRKSLIGQEQVLKKMRAMQQTIQQLQASLQKTEAIVSLKSQCITEAERELSARYDTIRHLEAQVAAVTECLTDARASHSSLLDQLEARDEALRQAESLSQKQDACIADLRSKVSRLLRQLREVTTADANTIANLRSQLGSAASQPIPYESCKQRQQEGDSHCVDTSPSQRQQKSPSLPSSPPRKAQQTGPGSGPGQSGAKAGKDSSAAMISLTDAEKTKVQDLVQDLLQDLGAAKQKLLPAQDPPPNSPAAKPNLEAANPAPNTSDAKVGVHLSGEASLSGLGRVVSAQGPPGDSAAERQRDSTAAHHQTLKAAAEQEPAAAMPQLGEEGFPDQPAGQLDATKGSCPVEESKQPQTGLSGRKARAKQAAFRPSADAHAGLLADSKTTRQIVEVQRRTAGTDSTLQTAAVGAPANSSSGTSVLEQRECSLGEKASARAADTVCELEIDLSMGSCLPGITKSTPSPQPSHNLLAARPTDPSILGSTPYLNPQSLPGQSAVAEPESRKRGIDKLDSSEAHRSVEPRPRDQPQQQPRSNPGEKAASENFDRDARTEGQCILKDGGTKQQAQCGIGGHSGASCASGLPVLAAKKALHVPRQSAEPAREAEAPRALFSCFDLLADLPASVDPGAASEGNVSQASQPAAHDTLPAAAELAVKVQPTGQQQEPTAEASNLGKIVQDSRPQAQQKSGPCRQLPQPKRATSAAFAQPHLQQAAPAASPWPQLPQEPRDLQPQPPQTQPGESFRNRALKLLQNASSKHPTAMTQLTSPAGSSMQCPCGRPSDGLMLSCVHCQAVQHPECGSRCVPDGSPFVCQQCSQQRTAAQQSGTPGIVMFKRKQPSSHRGGQTSASKRAKGRGSRGKKA